MGRHTAGHGAPKWLLPVLGVLAVTGLVVAGALAVLIDSPSDSAGNIVRLSCDRPVRVVTATSFAPVLDAAAAELSQTTTTASGWTSRRRTAGTRCSGPPRSTRTCGSRTTARGWARPDRSAWPRRPAADAGAVLATSPLLHGRRPGHRRPAGEGRREPGSALARLVERTRASGWWSAIRAVRRRHGRAGRGRRGGVAGRGHGRLGAVAGPTRTRPPAP